MFTLSTNQNEVLFDKETNNFSSMNELDNYYENNIINNKAIEDRLVNLEDKINQMSNVEGKVDQFEKRFTTEVSKQLKI